MRKLSLILFVILFTFGCTSNENKWFQPGGFPTEKGTEFIISANFPYYSLTPDPDVGSSSYRYWEDVLFQIKAAGFNGIYLRLPWEIHEETPGEIDFTSENKNLRMLLLLSTSLNLKILVNIAPQSIKEFNGGGIPLWARRFLTYLPSTSPDHLIALRTTDYEFLDIFSLYLLSFTTISFPYLWAPELKNNPVILLNIETSPEELDSIWYETSNFLSITPPSSTSYLDQEKEIVKKGKTSVPIFVTDSPEYLSGSWGNILFKGEKVYINQKNFNEKTLEGKQFKFLHLLTENDPYEILNGYVSGGSGVILQNFSTVTFPNDWQGWEYSSASSTLTMTSPLKRGELSPFSPLTVTGAEIRLINKWLLNGYFPRRCRYINWSTKFSGKNCPTWSWLNFSSKITGSLIRKWQCKDSNMEVDYSDENRTPSIKITGESFPSVSLRNCQILYAGRDKKLFFLLLEKNEKCEIISQAKQESVPHESTYNSDEIYSNFNDITYIKIASPSFRGKVLLIFVPQNLLPYTDIDKDFLFSGSSYQIIDGDEAEVETNKSFRVIKVESPYPEVITYSQVFTMSEYTTSVSQALYMKEEPFEHDLIQSKEGCIEGEAFHNYFTSPPYNYTSGIYLVSIPFTTSMGGNGYLLLPRAEGIFAIFLNGNYLGTRMTYGNDIILPFAKNQIKTYSTNRLNILALPSPAFPMLQPSFLSDKTADILKEEGKNPSLFTLFNFYHRAGFMGQGFIVIDNQKATIKSEWCFFPGLWGERNKVYEEISSGWEEKTLPIKVQPGKVVWVKKIIPLPSYDLDNSLYTIKVKVEGKNIFARVYYNDNVAGNLFLPSPHFMPLNLTSTKNSFLLYPQKNDHFSLTIAIFAYSPGEIDKIKITFSKPEIKKWISLP